MEYRTIAYKGSKRKLLEQIQSYAKEIKAKTFFDGFSGTGIVSAHMRKNGYVVAANDLNFSSYVYGSVFLNGFEKDTVEEHLSHINQVSPLSGWLTANYSGTSARVIRGTGGNIEERPRGFIRANAMKIDAAREYIESKKKLLSEHTYNALVFSVILGADKVFNNSNDQKSALKEWTKSARKPVVFKSPTLIEGPRGKQLHGDILEVGLSGDMVYLDPPYTHGVLYASCYHLNDSIAHWNKPVLDYDYAIPRPIDVCFRKNAQRAGGFYNKTSARIAFENLFKKNRAKRIVLSYSDAPRNTLTIEELIKIGKCYGNVKVDSLAHQLCMQPKSQLQRSTQLKEHFIVVDK